MACSIPPRIHPSGHIQRQQHQRQQPERAHSRAPAHPELPRIFVRLAREIDIKTHSKFVILSVAHLRREDSGEPRDASRCLRRNNRASDSLPYYEINAPTTPAILQRGTEPPVLAPSCADDTSSCTSAPVCARSAGAAPPDSGSPAT